MWLDVWLVSCSSTVPYILGPVSSSLSIYYITHVFNNLCGYSNFHSVYLSPHLPLLFARSSGIPNVNFKRDVCETNFIKWASMQDHTYCYKEGKRRYCRLGRYYEGKRERRRQFASGATWKQRSDSEPNYAIRNEDSSALSLQNSQEINKPYHTAGSIDVINSLFPGNNNVSVSRLNNEQIISLISVSSVNGKISLILMHTLIILVASDTSQAYENWNLKKNAENLKHEIFLIGLSEK